MPLVNTSYRVQVSDRLDDPEWDTFVASTPGGGYQQTSWWARSKPDVQAARVIVTQDGAIVGGAQILMRCLPLVGGYGYVAMGPVVASDDPELAATLIEALNDLARRRRIHYLVAQPPLRAEALADRFRDYGFFPTSREVAPSATILIDLVQGLDEILGQMNAKTRRNIRYGERKGVVVREGGEGDVEVFHRLLLVTSKRQDFSPPPASSFAELWRSLAPRGFAKLFIADIANEPVSALFVISSGDTVVDWRVGWSGQQGTLHPNEVIKWAAIQWAKEQGYRYYDMGGIHRNLAAYLARGEALPEEMAARNHFKIQFGGNLAVYPQRYAIFYNPLMRWLDSAASPALRQSWPWKLVFNLFH